ncbi:MAG: FliG C-terminal domain-containing protein [Notoacmeibacter sp.]
MASNPTEPAISDATLKATALLIAMGRPLAQRLVAKLNEEELRQISRSAKTLPAMNRTVVEALVEEFASSFIDQVANTTPDAEIDAIFNEGLGVEAAGRLFTAPKAEAPQSMWPFISKTEPIRLVAVLEAEPDVIVAATLSQLPPQTASQVLSLLQPARRAGIARCLLELGAMSPNALRVVETELYAKLTAVDPGELAGVNRKKVASLLNGLGREAARDILELLSAEDPASANAIEALLFDFDDISSLDQASRVTLFDTINPEQIILALSGADASMTELVLSSLGGRGRRMVEAEISANTSVPEDKSNAARRAIADAALTLLESGRIQIPPKEG